jgi:hypothetical protein
MASVRDLTCGIEVVNNGPNLEANITVEYFIDFSLYDQSSNQPYNEVCRMIGDDTGITPPEDGVDDAVPNGRLFPIVLFPPIPVPLFGQTQSNGQASVKRTRTKTLALSNLSEDATGLDELRAVVTLTPVLPATVTRESNQVALNIS